MAASKPLKGALVMARLTPAERRKIDKLCLANDITLSQALRTWALLYLEDLEASRQLRLRRRVTVK